MSGILLATHGGESADGATRVASLLAQRLGVGLHALAILEPLPLIDYGFGVTYAPSAEEAEGARSALLDSVAAQLRRCGVAGRVPELRVGYPAAEISSAARALGADLIVVGLGPHNVIDRAFGDETALNLVQVAATPVLALPADATAIPHHAIAAIDFSPTSILAARTVARWLGAGDVLHLVHVGPKDQRAARGTPALAVGEADVLARLAQIAATLDTAEGVRVDETELRGEPVRALLDQLQHDDRDMIALGSHGYGMWKRLRLGSVASKMIRLSTRAVLVVPLGCLTAWQHLPERMAARRARAAI